MRVAGNRSVKRGRPLDADERRIVGIEAPDEVRRYLPAFPLYKPTPLVSLPVLARSLGLGGIAVKDESHRYGLGSFKALGGAYAVARLVKAFVEQRLGRSLQPAELLGAGSRGIAAGLTVACATDGNHGRSVAAGAEMFGCSCVIFLHEGVTAGRGAAIAGFGARIVRTPGTYDHSIAAANDAAAQNGWTTVSDFSWPGYEDIPAMVMQGYTIMLDEIVRQSPVPFTHVFVQGGVGGLAAVAAGYFLDRPGKERPRLVVVERERANCLQQSAEACARKEIAPGKPTVMAMLECYEPSLIAWRILEKAADAYIDVPDGLAITALRRLARPLAGDAALTIGESGSVGLAGLLGAATDPSMRDALGLDAGSSILLFGTEGATDPELYERLLAQGLGEMQAFHE